LNKIRRVNAKTPDGVLVQETVRLLRQGGMVVLPTRHLYGLGVNALSPAAVARVFATKRRPPNRPILILLASREAVGHYAMGLDARATALMEAFWPGRLTIIVKAHPLLPAALTSGTGRIGIRVPEHPVARAIVTALNGPLTATSANRSGQPGCHRIEDLDPAVAAAADIVLDAGPLLPGVGSTVVDLRPDGVVLIREGAISRAALGRVLSDSPLGPPP
jgi:L-threonylcarbamoyladenylate synthase